jgi:hypothetical protein
VWCVHCRHMKIGFIYFLNAILANEFGITSKLIGELEMTFRLLCKQQDLVLVSHSSWR